MNILGEQAVNMLGNPGEQVVNNMVNMDGEQIGKVGEQLVNRVGEQGEHDQRQKLLKTFSTIEMCEELYARIMAGEV